MTAHTDLLSQVSRLMSEVISLNPHTEGVLMQNGYMTSNVLEPNYNLTLSLPYLQLLGK
jgi:hypothetical protein